MEAPEHGERRSYTRFPIAIPADVNLEGIRLNLHCHTGNISSHGLNICTASSIPEGALLDIVLEIEDNHEQVNSRGLAVWSKKQDQGRFVTGIRFLEKFINPVPLILRTIKLNRNY